MRRWWALPEVGVAPQLPLLAQFQRLVELQDSTRVLLDLGQQHHSPPDQPFAELKETLETWRLRAPNGWERLGAWADVLLWRNAVYNIVINAFKSYAETAPHLHQLGYRDKAWSVNRLARIARHQGCPEACKAAIGLLYGFNAMEVQEAFTKTTEQAKAFLLQARPAARGA
jgi:transformation/transcription domain-associated protein